MAFNQDPFSVHYYSIYIYVTFFTSLKIYMLQVMRMTQQYI